MTSTTKRKPNWKIIGIVAAAVLVLGFILQATGYQPESERAAEAAAASASAEASEQAAEREAVAEQRQKDAEAARASRAAEAEEEQRQKDEERAEVEAARADWLATDELPGAVEEAWLAGLGGVGSFTEMLGESETLVGYVSSIGPIDANTVRVTVQLPASTASRDVMKGELETVGRGCIGIGGYDLPQLTRCEVETADSEIIVAFSR
ncbi:hypothetical protein [Zhihengliuella halotolerans]|uniref:hypothetical protein n=1 Tax=Zhihengliuella halotolerans TaxID=370736 RepID=UPI000C7F9B06|nr:hypothetical protein [Zhihengliuella halotolerans]